ncbi:uncharacterized protein PpBr36_09265 [Pyricularia pennisetigena]|uniref:uncharacterized protein n=1 Tax=Pyricularia pennisetigena TaxID=1578925 RepID=UPI0011528FD2|nr:uncharacterized protein PpBr36_09265 [Pyricularia pennisetigena]TLS21914.1 hypothetical protein PpBr36_09265 [Pyricularia pennisetigena]
MSPSVHKQDLQAFWRPGFEKRKRRTQDNVAVGLIHAQQQLLWQGDTENPFSRPHKKSIAALTRANECIRMASSGSQRGGSVGGDGSGNTGREGTRGSSSSQKFRALLPSTPGGPSKRPPSPTGPGGLKKPKRVAVPAACQSAYRLERAEPSLIPGLVRESENCDGVRPVCAACAATKVICEYSVPEGLSQRDAERRQLQQMEAVSKANQEAVSKAKQELRALVDELRRDGQASQILQKIQDAPSLDDAVAVVSSIPDIAAHGGDYIEERIDEPMIRHQLRPGESSGHEMDWQPTEMEVARWTRIADNNGLLTHLLSLFWTWDNTVSPIIDRCMFLEDLKSAALSHSRALPPGAKQVFCTPFLVNSLLAVACLYSTNPNVYTVPTDTTSRGRSFAEESKRLLRDEPRSLTKLQGIGLLWLWESCAGDIQMTDEFMETYFRDYMLLQLSTMEIPSDFEDWDSREGRELQALSHIIWGMYFTHAYVPVRLPPASTRYIFSAGQKRRNHLDIKANITTRKMAVTFQTPFRAPRPRIRQIFADEDIPHISNAETAHWWPYLVNDSRHLEPLRYRRLLVARCELSKIIEDANNLLSHGRFKADPTSMEIARSKSRDCYAELIEWKAKLPEYLKAEYSTLPVVILLHTLYDSAVIEILNPLMEHFYNDTNFARSTPKQLRLAANFSLIHHVCIYRVLYSAKYEYSILQACLKAATTALYDLHDGGVDIFLRACQGLYEAGEFLKLANTFLAVTKGLLEANKLNLPGAAAIVDEKFYPELKHRSFTPFKEDGHLLMYWPKKVVDHDFSGLIKRAELLSIKESPSRTSKISKRNKTYHWTKSRDTSAQCQHGPYQADLVEALAEYVKNITGRDAGDVDVDAVGEHQARALDEGGARDDAPDAEDLELVRHDRLGVDLDGGRVARQALLELLGRGVAADGAAGLEPTAVEAGDLARVRQVGQQLAARDALPRDGESQGRDRGAEHPGLADDLGQGHRGGRVLEGRDGREVCGVAERAPVVRVLGLVEVSDGEQVALDSLVGVLADGVVAKHGADEEVL